MGVMFFLVNYGGCGVKVFIDKYVDEDNKVEFLEDLEDGFSIV